MPLSYVGKRVGLVGKRPRFVKTKIRDAYGIILDDSEEFLTFKLKALR